MIINKHIEIQAQLQRRGPRRCQAMRWSKPSQIAHRPAIRYQKLVKSWTSGKLLTPASANTSFSCLECVQRATARRAYTGASSANLRVNRSKHAKTCVWDVKALVFFSLFFPTAPENVSSRSGAKKGARKPGGVTVTLPCFLAPFLAPLREPTKFAPLDPVLLFMFVLWTPCSCYYK